MGEADYHLDKIYKGLVAPDPSRATPTIPTGCRCVLDVGCGAGQTFFACGTSRDVIAVGVDCDMEALKLGKTFWPWINFTRGTGEGLPFKEDCFDFAFARVSLPYMRIRVALAELNRVLRPGAELWITLHPVSKAVQRILHGARTLDFKDVLYQCYVLANGLSLHLLGREFDFPLSRRRHESVQTDRSIRRALEACGFERLEISRETSFLVTAKKRGAS